MEELSNTPAAEQPQPEMTQEETMQQNPAGETATAPIEEKVAETTEPETSAEPEPVAEMQASRCVFARMEAAAMDM